MGGDRGGGGGRGPGPAPGKLQVIYFQEEKTGTNFPQEATGPRWSCLDQDTHVRRWNFIFICTNVAGLAIILSRAR